MSPELWLGLAWLLLAGPFVAALLYCFACVIASLMDW